MIDAFSRLADFVRRSIQRFVDDHGLRTAGSLTYTTLLSLVPIVTVAFALLSAFPGFRGMFGVIQEFVFENLMPASVETIQTYTTQFVDSAAQLTTVGVVFLALTALMLLLTIDEAFNGIWRVRRVRPLGQRLLIYWAVITIGPVLIGVSLTLTSRLIGASAGWAQGIPYADAVLIKVSAMLMTSAALALLYYAMPNRPVRARDALIGGVLAGVAFEFTKQGFGLYIAHFPTYTLVYGAFAAVPVFLLWIYVSWVVVLAGAVVVATLPEWRRQAVWGRLAPGMHFIYALQMLKLLWKARERGEGVTLAQMHNALNIGYERIEMLLGVMEQAGWVRRGDATGWGLYRDAHTITVAEIYRQFVFDPAVAADGKDEFAGTVQALGQGVDASSSAVVTLQALFTPPVGVETGESQKD